MYLLSYTWKTVSIAMENESKLEAGVPKSKLNVPPKSCIPRSAKIRMNRNRSSKSDTMDFREAKSDTTRLRSEDQYLNYIVITFKCHFQDFDVFLKLYLLCNFEYSKQSQSSQHRQSKGSSLRFEMCPYNLKDTPTDHKAVKSEYKNVFMAV